MRKIIKTDISEALQSILSSNLKSASVNLASLLEEDLTFNQIGVAKPIVKAYLESLYNSGGKEALSLDSICQIAANLVQSTNDSFISTLLLRLEIRAIMPHYGFPWLIAQDQLLELGVVIVKTMESIRNQMNDYKLTIFSSAKSIPLLEYALSRYIIKAANLLGVDVFPIELVIATSINSADTFLIGSVAALFECVAPSFRLVTVPKDTNFKNAVLIIDRSIKYGLGSDLRKGADSQIDLGKAFRNLLVVKQKSKRNLHQDAIHSPIHEQITGFANSNIWASIYSRLEVTNATILACAKEHNQEEILEVTHFSC